MQGFSQNICLLCLIANDIIFLCVFGGDAIIIALIFLSNINFFQSVKKGRSVIIFFFFLDLNDIALISNFLVLNRALYKTL